MVGARIIVDFESGSGFCVWRVAHDGKLQRDAQEG